MPCFFANYFEGQSLVAPNGISTGSDISVIFGKILTKKILTLFYRLFPRK